MKSLVYLITSSELRRLDVDSEGACAGREGELPLDRERGARKRTKSCRRGAARARARRSGEGARRTGRARERARRVRARTCGLDPMAKLAKVPAVGPVPPGRREMVSIVVACLDSRLAADEKSAESVPAGCELGTEATDERHAGSAIRRRESVAGATRPAVGAHAS